MLKIKIKENKLLDETRFLGDWRFGIIALPSRGIDTLILIDLDTFGKAVTQIKQTLKIPDNKELPKDSINEPMLSAYIGETKKYPIIAGGFEFSRNIRDKHPCLNAIQTKVTNLHEQYIGKGFGKMLYKLALAYAADKYRRPIMPDRGAVSMQASELWRQLEADPDVTTKFSKSGKPLYGGASDDPNIYSMFSVDAPSGSKVELNTCFPTRGYPEGHPVNKAYYSAVMAPQLNKMISNTEKFLVENFQDVQQAENILAKLFAELFFRVYAKRKIE